MKEPVLVIIKPDGIVKGLIGNIFRKFARARLQIIGLKVVKATKKQAEVHYCHLQNEYFFKETVDYFRGKFHKQKEIMMIVFYGDRAVKKCRQIAGATNPKEAHPTTIRGAYGRITARGVYENVVHVSSDRGEAEREIKLWFEPQDIAMKLYATKITKIVKRVWA